MLILSHARETAVCILSCGTLPHRLVLHKRYEVMSNPVIIELPLFHITFDLNLQ